MVARDRRHVAAGPPRSTVKEVPATFAAHLARWAPAALVAFGGAFRLRQYFFNRSLWSDEAALAGNFFDRGWFALLQPLDFHQAAPAGFLWLSKAAVSIFGLSEPALRLAPLIFGLATLLLLARMAGRWLEAAGAAFALLLAAISSTLIYYASEFKPYGCDATIALGLLLLLRPMIDGEDFSHRRFWWALPGLALAPWCSFPSVFVLAGVLGGAWLTAGARRDGPALRTRGWLTVAAAAGSLTSFVFFSRHHLAIPGMRDYWAAQSAFMPLPPRHGSDFTWFTGQAFNYFESVGGLHASRNLLFALALVGAASWGRQTRWGRLAACVAPLLLAALVSGLQLYPFQGRLLLFSVPGLLLVAGAGIEAIWKLTQPARHVAIILATVALFSPGAYTLSACFRGMEVEEVRPLVERLKREPTAVEGRVLVAGGDTIYAYYARRLDAPAPLSWRTGEAPPLALREPAGAPLWLVVAHLPGDTEAGTLRAAAAHGWDASLALRTTGAALFRLRRSEPRD
jgi:hypothetical protein